MHPRVGEASALKLALGRRECALVLHLQSLDLRNGALIVCGLGPWCSMARDAKELAIVGGRVSADPEGDDVVVFSLANLQLCLALFAPAAGTGENLDADFLGELDTVAHHGLPRRNQGT